MIIDQISFFFSLLSHFFPFGSQFLPRKRERKKEGRKPPSWMTREPRREKKYHSIVWRSSLFSSFLSFFFSHFPLIFFFLISPLFLKLFSSVGGSNSSNSLERFIHSSNCVPSTELDDHSSNIRAEMMLSKKKNEEEKKKRNEGERNKNVPNFDPKTGSSSVHPMMTPYEKIAKCISQNDRWRRELTLGRRIGFYRIRGDVGSGNFSQVKVATHSLTGGKWWNTHTLEHFLFYSFTVLLCSVTVLFSSVTVSTASSTMSIPPHLFSSFIPFYHHHLSVLYFLFLPLFLTESFPSFENETLTCQSWESCRVSSSTFSPSLHLIVSKVLFLISEFPFRIIRIPSFIQICVWFTFNLHSTRLLIQEERKRN